MPLVAANDAAIGLTRGNADGRLHTGAFQLQLDPQRCLHCATCVIATALSGQTKNTYKCEFIT